MKKYHCSFSPFGRKALYFTRVQILIATHEKYLFRSLCTKNPEAFAFRIFFICAYRHNIVCVEHANGAIAVCSIYGLIVDF